MMYRQLNDSIGTWAEYQQVSNLNMQLPSTQLEPSRTKTGLNINAPATPYGDIHLVRMRLNHEFNHALENLQGREDLESSTDRLIRSLGFSGYAFLGLDLDKPTGKIRPPNRYLTTYSPDVYRSCAAQLHCALKQTSNIQLSSLYHWEENIGINSDGSGMRWGCYVLITDTGNYGYLLPGGSFSNNHKVALSVMSEELKPDEFRKRMERSQLALDALARAIDKTGQNTCPDLFLEGRSASISGNKIQIANRPLQLLQALAAEDLTLNQAAEKLGITRNTANKHIAAAKAALGAKTMVGAMLKAIEERLIEVY